MIQSRKFTSNNINLGKSIIKLILSIIYPVRWFVRNGMLKNGYFKEYLFLEYRWKVRQSARKFYSPKYFLNRIKDS